MVHVARYDVERRAMKMMEELHKMKQDKAHCDFIIQVGNDVYYAHKNILSAGSDYFKAMLKHDTKESRENRVDFKDADSECVKNCIDFIYSSQFRIPDGKIIELLHTAIMMQLEDLKKAISNILAKSINVQNYFFTRKVADIYGLVDVTSRCRQFLHRDNLHIVEQAEFGSVQNFDLRPVLKWAESKLWEEEKLELSLQWIETCEKKREYLHECLELIDFERISPAILARLLETDPIIRNDSKSYELINKHLLEAQDGMVNRKELIIIFDNDTDCIRSLNPTTNKITKFHNARCMYMNCLATITLNPHIYILYHRESVHRLDFLRKNSNWEKMEDMTWNHGFYPPSVSLLGSIFVIGGSYSVKTNVVERFDPSVNRWFQLQNMPTAICASNLVSMNDSVYCIGGYLDGVQVASFYRFTPSSSEWVDLEPMRYPVHGSGAVAVDQKIFVIGGLTGTEQLDNVECYDVASAQWTSLTSMNFKHGFNSAYQTGNWIFVVDECARSNFIEKYDLLNEKWYCIGKLTDRSLRLRGSAMVKE